MRKYGKKGGLFGQLTHFVNNHNAHTTDIPYTTPRPIIPMFEPDPLITPYGKTPPQSLLHEHIKVNPPPSTEFIYLNKEGNIPPPPRNPHKGKKDVVDDNNKKKTDPLDLFKKKYDMLDQYNNKREERIDNLYENYELAKKGIQ